MQDSESRIARTANIARQRVTWMRFGLRSLLILITLLCLLLGTYVSRSEKQRKAIGRLAALGGDTTYNIQAKEYHFFNQKFYLWVQDPRKPGAIERSEVARLLGPDYAYPPHSFHLAGHKATPSAGEEYLRELAKLPGLKSINLGYVKLSTAQLKLLAGQRSLAELNLESAVLDQGSFDSIAHLPLQILNVQRTHFSDAGLRSFAHHQTLRYLNLTRTRVSDQSIEVIATMPNLREIYLCRSRVTKESAMELSRRRPKLLVHWERLDPQRKEVTAPTLFLGGVPKP